MKNPSLKTMSTFQTKTRGYPLSTRWLHFHTYWRLPIQGVASVLFFINTLNTLSTMTETNTGGALAIALFYYFAAIVFWWAFIVTRKLDKSGYRINMFIFSMSIVWALVVCIFSAFMLWFSLILRQYIASSVVSAIVAICNIVYFHKRKSLFGFETANAPTQEPPVVQEPIAAPTSVAPADESSALYFAVKDGAIGTFARRLTLFYTAVRQHPSCKGCTVEQILSVSMYLNMLPHLSENAAIGDICAAVRSVKLAESGCIRASGVERKHSASPASETELIGYAAMQGIAVANCLDGTRSPEENVSAALYFRSAIADIVKETFEQKSTTAEWDTIKDTVSHYFDNPFFLSNFLFIKPSPDMTVEKKQKTKFYSVVCE